MLKVKYKNLVSFVAIATLTASQIPSIFAAGILPSGGQIVGGSGTISQNSSSMTINQQSSRLAINWQGFSVGQGNTVNFVQPNSNSVALNQVLGADVSVIQGQINANGQVFLINPNGVLFTPSAQVNVGGIMASTLKMSVDNFMSGTYNFSGDSANAVINQGNITAVGDGTGSGFIGLVAAKVINTGSLVANKGNVSLAAASDVTLDLGGPVKLQINQGAMNAAIENGGVIQADGGTIYLTAQALNQLTTATINNTGIIRAQTLSTGETGVIRLLADMQTGTTNISGTLDASAPNGGDGGAIETSAHIVNIANDARLTTLATSSGNTGTWLIDPDILQILPTGGVSTIASMPSTGYSQLSVGTLNTALSTSNVSLQANQYIDIQTGFTYSGSRNALLGFYAPQILLGADLAASSGALSLTFGGLYSGTTYAGNVYLYNGARNISTNGGNIIFNGNLGGGQDLTLNTRSAGGTSGTITHNALVNGTFSAITSSTGTLAVTASGFNNGWISFDFVNGYINKYTGGSLTGGLYVGGTIVNGASNGGTFPVRLTMNGAQLTGGVTFLAGGTVLNLNGTSNGTLNIYFTDGKPMLATTLSSAGGGNANYTVPAGGLANVARIEYMGANSSGTTYQFPNITYHVLGNATPLNNYVALSDTTGGQFTLNQPLSVNGNITISSQQIVNNAGGSALTVGAGDSWNIWSTNPNPYASNGTGDNLGNLAYAFKQYNATYGVTSPAASGNGYFLSYAPVITLGIGTAQTKTYDGSSTAILAPSAFTVSSGVVGGDNVSLVSSNLPTSGNYSKTQNGQSTTTQNTDATTVTASLSGINMISATGSNGTSTVNVYGYQVNNTATGAGTITPATATLNGVKVYDSNANFSSSSITVTGVNGETLSLTGAGPAVAASSQVGDNSTNYFTSLGGLTLGSGGTGLPSNYVLPSLSSRSINNTATINPANLTVLGLTGSKYYDGTATFNASQLILGSGIASGDSLTLGGSATVSSANQGTYNSWATSNLSLTGTNSANYTLTGGTVHVVINKAPLGIDVLGVYSGSTALTINGSPTLTKTNALIETNGLVNGETITGVTISNANVVGNGSNTVVSATGGGSTTLFNINNYQLGSSQNLANGSAFAGTQTGAATTTNAVWLKPAPLGVAVSGTYNGTTTYNNGSGTTITAYGLVGQDSNVQLSSATLAASGAGTNKISSVTGPSPFDPRNYVLDGSLNTTSSTAGAAIDGSGATNAAVIAKAALGIDVLGVYNGTTSLTIDGTSNLTKTNALIETNGLVNNETITGVTISNANVVGNGSNTVVSATGGGTTSTFNINNYQLGSSQNIANGTAFAGAQTGAATTTNAVWLKPAPLGVAVSGTYNGTTTYNNGGGTTITAYGLVGQDSNVQLSSATLAAAGAGTNQISSVTGPTPFDPRNYLLNGSLNTTSPGTAGSLIDGSGATNAAVIAKAALGIDVLGVYNGSTGLTINGSPTLTKTNALIEANGLVNGETITGVTISNANVVGNGSNTVVSATGGGSTSIFNINNYQLGSSQNLANGSAFAGTQTGAATTTNAVWLKPAPLGVAVSGTYNGTSTYTNGNGTTITAYGLVGQDAGLQLTTASLATTGAGTNKISSVTGPSPFDPRNYSLDGSLNTTNPGTAGSSIDGSGATNAAVIAKAALGIDVLGVYNGSTGLTINGTTTLTKTNALIETSGLVNGETITGVTISNANVVGNGSNTVVSATGGGTSSTFNINNYQLGSSQNLANGSAFAGTQTGAATTTNSVWLKPAPLGVQVSATDNGTTTYTNGGGTTITAYGLVGQDSGLQLSSVVLATSGTGTNKVASVAGPSPFDPRNYVLDGSLNTASGTAGSSLDGSGATNAASIVAPGTIPTPAPTVELPPSRPSPIIVPTFVDNGSAAKVDVINPSLGGLNYVSLNGPVQSSTLNYVAPENSTSVKGSPIIPGASSSTLNYVSSNSVTEANSPVTAKRKSTSEMNVNDVTVPSATGPLDVFIVGSGVNQQGIQTIQAIANQ